VPEKLEINAYLSGYADGEGCFCVSINKSKRHKFRWEIRPSFSVSQNRERAEVLKLFKNRFQCGSIRPDRSDKTLKYEVRNIEDLNSNIIPHFEKYPLISSKQKDFELFAEICKMMINKAHLTKEGLTSILTIASQINPTGNKKFSRTTIKI
jgi:hypothetical protein